MSGLRRGLWAVLFAYSLPLHASETAADFAYAYPLNATTHAAFHRAQIPRFVYEHTARPDLGDVRVFDRDGALVPHLIRRRAEQEEVRSVNLPLFPVHADARMPGDDLSVRVEKDASGTILKVGSTSERPGEARAVAFYLLDATKVKAPIRGLQLQWSGTGFMGDLRVEASDDLMNWTPLVRTPLAKLVHAGRALNHGHIAFAARKTRYLRLTWAQNTPAVTLSAASAQTLTHPEREREWVSVTGTAQAKEPGSYAFALRGAMPIDRARVVLPQPNTIVTVHLHSRENDRAAWQWRSGGVVSNADKAAALPDNELDFAAPMTASHWLLRVEQKEAGLGRGEPVLQLGWLPEELVFVARGAPPYTLAFGNANALPVAHGLDQLLARSGEARVTAAQLGGLRTLRGDAALRTSAVAVDGKRLSLWAVLVLGVLVLAVIARRLFREL